MEGSTRISLYISLLLLLLFIFPFAFYDQNKTWRNLKSYSADIVNNETSQLAPIEYQKQGVWNIFNFKP
jgi:hypothetical protein